MHTAWPPGKKIINGSPIFFLDQVSNIAIAHYVWIFLIESVADTGGNWHKTVYKPGRLKQVLLCFSQWNVLCLVLHCPHHVGRFVHTVLIWGDWDKNVSKQILYNVVIFLSTGTIFRFYLDLSPVHTIKGICLYAIPSWVLFTGNFPYSPPYRLISSLIHLKDAQLLECRVVWLPGLVLVSALSLMSQIIQIGMSHNFSANISSTFLLCATVIKFFQSPTVPANCFVISVGIWEYRLLDCISKITLVSILLSNVGYTSSTKSYNKDFFV